MRKEYDSNEVLEAFRLIPTEARITASAGVS